MQSMNTRSLLVLGVLLGLIVAGTGLASAQVATAPADEPSWVHQTNATTTTETTNETNVSPGAHLSGMVGVQQVELDGDVERRSFERAFWNAGSNDSRARLVARNGETLETRLNELQGATRHLEAAAQNDSIGQGQYQSQAAILSARIATLERRLNQTSDAGRTIPPAVREQHGVNITRLGHLQRAAGNLSGPEMAAIARTIAGPNPGMGPGMTGPPETVGNGPQGPPANRTGPPENSSAMSPRADGSSSMGPRAANESTSGSVGMDQGRERPGNPTPQTDGQSSKSGSGPPADQPDNSAQDD